MTESLAGRAAIFELSGLTQRELEKLPAAAFSPDIEDIRERFKKCKVKSVSQIYEAIFNGSMPEIAAERVDREQYYSNYVNTYLERDVADLSQVGKLDQFYDFLVFMAARTSQELKYSDISSAIGVSLPTVREWVTILERSGVIYILHPYYSNLTKRLIKTPKMYFMDTGLAAYLCRWPDFRTLESGAMSGAFLETYVVTEIVKSFYNIGKEPDLFYYRDIDKKEIDLVFALGQDIYPIEIKKAANPKDPAKNFSVLGRLGMNICPGLILCLREDLVPYDRENWLCPISVL